MTDCGLSRGWSYMLFIKNGQERKGISIVFGIIYNLLDNYADEAMAICRFSYIGVFSLFG